MHMPTLKRHWSVDDLDDLPDDGQRYEVIDGELFRDEGVAEFWIVDLDARTFERSTPADSRVEVPDARIEWRPHDASTPLVIDVPRYFAEVLDA